jgi:hypothetical protein
MSSNPGNAYKLSESNSLDTMSPRCYGQHMKLGCFGCLILILVMLVLVVVAVGVFLISGNLLGSPAVSPISFSKADGYAAQQKLYEVALRQAGRSTRKDPISLTEREASAFLSRHLTDEDRALVSDVTVRFDSDQFVAQAQLPLRALLRGPIFSSLAPYITNTRFDRAVWVSVRGRITIDESGIGGKRHGGVQVTEFTLGRQSISPLLLYVVTGPSGGGWLEWQVPSVVESIRIEGGRAIIRTR